MIWQAGRQKDDWAGGKGAGGQLGWLDSARAGGGNQADRERSDWWCGQSGGWVKGAGEQAKVRFFGPSRGVYVCDIDSIKKITYLWC